MKRWIAPQVLVDNCALSKQDFGEKPTPMTIWRNAKNIPADFYPEQGTSVAPITNTDHSEWAISKIVFWGDRKVFPIGESGLVSPFGRVGNKVIVCEEWAEPANDGVYYFRAGNTAVPIDQPKWQKAVFMPSSIARFSFRVASYSLELTEVPNPDEDAEELYLHHWTWRVNLTPE